MAKTLIYAAGSPTSVKLGDTDTDLYLQVAKDNVAIDLTAVKSITVKIADANKNYLKDISIAPSSLTSGNNGILTVPLNSDNVGGLNSGDYYFEVWIITADKETEIYPDMNLTKFHVFNNLVGGTTILTTLTMQAFLDRITANQTASETSLNNSQVALAAANTANLGATQALNNLNAGNYLTKDTLSNAPSFEALQTQVNNSAVGTNLLVGTSGDLQTTNNATNWNSNLPSWRLPDSLFTNGSLDFTFRCFVSPASHDIQLQVAYNAPQSGAWSVALGSSPMPAGSSGYLTGSGTIPQGATGAYATLAFISQQQDNTTVSYKEAKLELGSHATDHSLNPSEILTQSDYAKIKAAIVALGGSLS